jgi:hypothetical protein
MPAPLKASEKVLGTVKVYAGAPALNANPPTVVLAENDRLVVVDVPKNAVPVGTVAGVQLVAVLKLPEPGLSSHVASCACADAAASKAAAAVVANKYARIPLAPPAEMSQRRLACSYKTVDHPSSRQCFLSPGSADLLQTVALRPRMG